MLQEALLELIDGEGSEEDEGLEGEASSTSSRPTLPSLVSPHTAAPPHSNTTQQHHSAAPLSSTTQQHHSAPPLTQHHHTAPTALTPHLSFIIGQAPTPASHTNSSTAPEQLPPAPPPETRRIKQGKELRQLLKQVHGCGAWVGGLRVQGLLIGGDAKVEGQDQGGRGQIGQCTARESQQRSCKEESRGDEGRCLLFWLFRSH